MMNLINLLFVLSCALFRNSVGQNIVIDNGDVDGNIDVGGDTDYTSNYEENDNIAGDIENYANNVDNYVNNAVDNYIDNNYDNNPPAQIDTYDNDNNPPAPPISEDDDSDDDCTSQSLTFTRVGDAECLDSYFGSDDDCGLDCSVGYQMSVTSSCQISLLTSTYAPTANCGCATGTGNQESVDIAGLGGDLQWSGSPFASNVNITFGSSCTVTYDLGNIASGSGVSAGSGGSSLPIIPIAAAGGVIVLIGITFFMYKSKKKQGKYNEMDDSMQLEEVSDNSSA